LTGLITGIRSDIGGWAQAWRRSLEYSIAANCGAGPDPSPAKAGEGSYWRTALGRHFLSPTPLRATPSIPLIASGGVVRYNQNRMFVNMFTNDETFGATPCSQ
jgi:hypothetical protein